VGRVILMGGVIFLEMSSFWGRFLFLELMLDIHFQNNSLVIPFLCVPSIYVLVLSF